MEKLYNLPYKIYDIYRRIEISVSTDDTQLTNPPRYTGGMVKGDLVTSRSVTDTVSLQSRTPVDSRVMRFSLFQTTTHWWETVGAIRFTAHPGGEAQVGVDEVKSPTLPDT